MISEDTCVYGGSFFPPGLHHRKIVKALKEIFKNVIIRPCGFRADKADLSLVSPMDRETLIDLTFSDIERVKINYRDLRDGVFTPTWRLDEEYSCQKKVWHVLGPDLIKGGAKSWSEIHRMWQRGPEIWQELQFAVVCPKGCGFDPRDLPPHSKVILMEQVGGRSTKIRQAIAKGLSFEYMVMPNVAAIIKYNHLFGYVNDIPTEYRCSRCKGDMRRDEGDVFADDACSCCGSYHSSPCSANREYRAPDEPYDGYGVYDYVRYLTDHFDN